MRRRRRSLASRAASWLTQAKQKMLTLELERHQRLRSESLRYSLIRCGAAAAGLPPRTHLCVIGFFVCFICKSLFVVSPGRRVLINNGKLLMGSEPYKQS